MKTYKKENGYLWGLEGKWQLHFCEAIYEGYLDSLPALKPYLDRTRTFSYKQYFTLHAWKQLFKRLIKRVKK